MKYEPKIASIEYDEKQSGWETILWQYAPSAFNGGTVIIPVSTLLIILLLPFLLSIGIPAQFVHGQSQKGQDNITYSPSRTISTSMDRQNVYHA